MMNAKEIVSLVSDELAATPYHALEQIWLQYDEEGEVISENRVVFDSEREVVHSDFLIVAMLQDQVDEETFAQALVRTDVAPRRALVWCQDEKRVVYFDPQGSAIETVASFSGKAEDRAIPSPDSAQIGHLVPGGEEMDEEARKGFAEGFDMLASCLEVQASRGELDDSLVPFLAIPEQVQHESFAAAVDFSEELPLDFSGTIFHIPLSHDFPMGETLRRYIDLIEQAPFDASTIMLPAGREENKIRCFFFSYDRRNSAVGLVRFLLELEEGKWRPAAVEFFDAEQLVDIIISGD